MITPQLVAVAVLVALAVWRATGHARSWDDPCGCGKAQALLAAGAVLVLVVAP